MTSTRSVSKTARTLELCASRVLIEKGKLSEALREEHPNVIDAVLELLGDMTMHDLLLMVMNG